MRLAATKLRPPMPPRQLVRRSRLDDILDVAIDSRVRLILVSAPAGTGKSTLLTSWLAGGTEAVAWLQAEEGDSDPTRFWSYLVEAIGHAHPIDVPDLKPLVIGSRGDDLVVVSALINALAAVAGPLVMVIDDYHFIESDSVHRGMERLIDLCPQQVTIVTCPLGSIRPCGSAGSGCAIRSRRSGEPICVSTPMRHPACSAWQGSRLIRLISISYVIGPKAGPRAWSSPDSP